MIFRLSKKCNEQNKLIRDDNNNIININKLESKAVKFEKSVVKDKKKTENDDEFIIFKIKNVKLANILHRMIKQNLSKSLCERS